ncbi:PP2C family protein-serine/threonine phosphatase [Amycolatopsis alkalitolerans]|uniref:PP2C family protein-serine/threonine phosphatase n=1 Tax=Amycolatopsis alkalitolerans TaxID=2547244 RepID=UPI001F318B79|nr:PP2C family protein-serine/threonine phosphatase [Amycolatopsis alkalitolerans]
MPGAGAHLGGDWYDLFRLPGDRFGVVRGDVSGHGLDPAVITGRLRSALRAYALDSEDPAQVLGKLDRKANHFEHGAMATVAYGVFDPGRRHLALSLAGHLPPVVASPGQRATLAPAPPDPPIGLTIATRPRRTTVLTLAPDTVLAFYTDGLVERRDQLIDVGMRRLTELIETDDPEHLCARVMTSQVGSRPAQDDVALLITRCGAACRP